MSAVRWVVLIVVLLSIVALVAFARGGDGEQRDRSAAWFQVEGELR